MVNAGRRKYHIIYKTTCDITNRFYIGMHSTDDLEDGYLGSGQVLWKSLRKYGKDKHSYEVLEYLEDRKSLALREQEIITKELLKDPLCMNLRLGGTGNYFPITKEETRQKLSIAGKGRPHSEEHKRRLSEAHKGKTMPREGVEKQRAKMTGRVVSEDEQQRRTEGIRKANAAKARAVIIDGIEYPSYQIAAQELGISKSTIDKRIHSKINMNYYYKDTPKSESTRII